ncbi:cleft lip and palate family protein [Cryptosporidium ryanae]|uniref:cleft lip and palate family protein n=1 Tax=Cryptosporidium ryanae TaxID=515981 RepID=UPI00351AA636|nr:cleft lip and palate family protein [Cryptosporidium ryanae]
MPTLQDNRPLENQGDETRNTWASGIIGTIFRVIIFQILINYFIGGRKTTLDKSNGKANNPLNNYFKPGDIYDLYAHLVFGTEETVKNISFEYIYKSAIFIDDYDINIGSILEVWKINDLIYNNSNLEISKNVSVRIPNNIFEYNFENKDNENNKLSAFLMVSLVGKDKSNFVPMNYVELIKVMNKLSDEDSLVSLLDQTENKTEDNSSRKQYKYWKDTINIRVIFDTQEYDISQSNVPPVSYMKYNVVENIYLPIVYPSDFWCIEANLKILDDFSKGKNFNLSLTFDTFSLFKYTVQRQMMDTWELQSRYGFGQSQKDIMMIKRILFEANRYYLIFSLIFFILHSSFQMLAFKNDISFWNNNDSMYGISGLSILSSFISEVVIGLYLFDSNETSWILLIEIFIGIAISAWKLWKTKIFTFSKEFPFVHLKSEKSFSNDSKEKVKCDQEALTRHYDSIAIKYMSIFLLPCVAGYAIYSLIYFKFKSWYSFIISTLAGTVYTFGFIMMTPQLYINYKLKSVDHLPWRFLIYKALNTFIDDIFSFIIDMPWMHRMACFRDDIIFIIYIYQRWIYRTDKNRTAFQDQGVRKENDNDKEVKNKDREDNLKLGELRNRKIRKQLTN